MGNKKRHFDDRLQATKTRFSKATKPTWLIVQETANGFRIDSIDREWRGTPIAIAKKAEDAEFLRHAIYDIPWLVEKLEELREDLKKLLLEADKAIGIDFIEQQKYQKRAAGLLIMELRKKWLE